jgi:curved DNA-binding protein CbpA
MSLYDDLGLTDDADGEQIKRAHRRGARRHHPDNSETGDRDKFERIQHAYLILSDPGKRARYDATGQTDYNPDNELSQIAEIVCGAFHEAINKARDRFKKTDLIAEAKAVIDRRKGQARETKLNIRAELAAQEELAKRLGFKGDGPDILRGAVTQKIAECRAVIARAEMEEQALKRALAYLAAYSFRFDKPEPSAQRVMLIRMESASTSSTA